MYLSSPTLWRPPSWSTWGLFGGRRDACIQLSWLTYCTPVWCADGHTCAGVCATSPLPLPALLLCFVTRHTCTYKLTHTCAKPHWYRHILIHVTTCLDINFYLPFTVQHVVAMTIFHLRQANLIKYTSDQWKSLRLDLLEVDRMTALIHYERQRCKKDNFFAKKPLPRSFFQHVQTLCMPSFIDMHTHATPGHVTSFACSRNTSDRSLAWSRHRRRSSTSTCAIDRDRGETWNTSGKPHAVACCTSRSTASTGSRSTGMQ